MVIAFIAGRSGRNRRIGREVKEYGGGEVVTHDAGHVELDLHPIALARRQVVRGLVSCFRRLHTQEGTSSATHEGEGWRGKDGNVEWVCATLKILGKFSSVIS